MTIPHTEEESFNLQHEPIGEVTFNGILYVPKDSILSFRQELLLKILEEIGQPDLDIKTWLGNNTVNIERQRIRAIINKYKQ